MLGLCLPPSELVKSEYRSLYPVMELGVLSKEIHLELLRRMNAQLKRWRPLLLRFLKSTDDQVPASTCCNLHFVHSAHV